MALDGIFLRTIKIELEKNIINSRVEKIYQPSKDEIIISLRGNGVSKKLLINSGANNPRIHFTELNIESPQIPPMFCMLLRKYIGSAKVKSIEQLNLDRIIYINFESINEIGDLTNIRLAVEIMGKHSNIILINNKNKIIDSIKRVTPDISTIRQILPNSTYNYPPIQDKLNIIENNTTDILEKIYMPPIFTLDKKLIKTIEGISPVVAREISYYVSTEKNIYNNNLSNDMKDRLKFYINNIKSNINNNKFNFNLIIEDNNPKDFSFIDINQYSIPIITKKFDSPSKLLDYFYKEKDNIIRTKQKAKDLFKLIINTIEKISKRIEIQNKKLIECKKKDKFKLYGELIISNIFMINKGDKKVYVDNYYESPITKIEINLEPELSPQKNAEKYFNKYKKLITAEKIAKSIIKKSKIELEYINSVFDSLTRSVNESDIIEIRQELFEQGYLKQQNKLKNKNIKSKPPLKFISSDGYTRSVNESDIIEIRQELFEQGYLKQQNKLKNKNIKSKPPLKFISSDGYIILCGRNNKQNDYLTLKQAKKHDIWLHTKDIPGSHVIIITNNEDIPFSTIKEAAIVAAVNSKAANSSKVPVDYTQVKNIKKPNGAKPGMVIFDNNKTIYINPDIYIIDKIKE